MTFFLTLTVFITYSQVENAGIVRKNQKKEKKEQSKQDFSMRLNSLFETNKAHDADVQYTKKVYRNLDLEKGRNATLYYPEDVIDGQENLFRIILNHVLDGSLPAYEYLDGKEIFKDQYKVKTPDLVKRFDLYAQEAKGSTENKPKFTIAEEDVPTTQISNYYLIEKWEFDNRTNDMKTTVEAIAPVLSKYGDYDSLTKYPMFWIKFDDLKPYLLSQYVFVSDDNNLPQYSLFDFFNLNLYEGELYKIQNMRNLSLAQMFPDEDDLKNAQDSIDNRLHSYGKNLWVPTREQYLNMKDSLDEANAKVTVVEEKTKSSSREKKKSKNNKRKTSLNSNSSANAEKSVKRRKR